MTRCAVVGNGDDVSAQKGRAPFGGEGHAGVPAAGAEQGEDGVAGGVPSAQPQPVGPETVPEEALPGAVLAAKVQHPAGAPDLV